MYNLKRDPKQIEKHIYIKNKKVYTNAPCIIEVPKRFEDKGLVTLGSQATIYGIFALIIGDKYSVSVIPTTMVTSPIVISEITRDDEVYYQFQYNKDDVIIDNTTTVKKNLLSYNLFELFYLYGKFPWYVEYEDIVRIMDNMPRYAESRVGEVHMTNEIIASFVTRDLMKPTEFVRQTGNYTDPRKYFYVSLNDPFYSSPTTLSKLGRNYFSDSLISALVEDEKEPNKLENLVRK